MTNPYYNPGTGISPHTTALAETVRAEFKKIEIAFSKLPDPTAVGTGGGAPNYTHYAYADSPDGTANFTTGAAGNRVYVGVATNQPSPIPSVYPEDYRWSRLRGADAADAVFGYLTKDAHTVPANASGDVLSYAGASGDFKIVKGTTEALSDISEAFVLSTVLNPQGLTVNYIDQAFAITGGLDQLESVASLTIRASGVGAYAGVTIDKTFTLTKVRNGADGTSSEASISAYLTREAVLLFAFAEGTVSSYTPAAGTFKVFEGTTDISEHFALSTASNPQTLTMNYVGRDYAVTGGFDAAEDTASVTIRATGSGDYAGIVLDKLLSLSKAKGGYEIVNALPGSNLFDGRVVYLTTDGKLYRYVTGTGWTASVPTVDLVGQLVASQIADGAVSTAKFAAGIEPVKVVTGAVLPTTNVGSVIYLTGTGKVYRWLGTAYVSSVPTADLEGAITSVQIGNDAITAPKIAANAVQTSHLAADSVTAGKIASGAVSTDELAANSIVTSKMLITGTGNALNDDPNTVDITAWSGIGLTIVDDSASPTGKALNCAGSDTILSRAMPLDSSRNYEFRIWAKQQQGAMTTYLTVAFFDAAGNVLEGNTYGTGWPSNGTYHYFGLTGVAMPGAWTEYRISFGPNETAQIPPGAKSVKVGLLSNYTGASPSQQRVTGVRLMLKTDAQLLVDGSVTTQKLLAGAVSTDKLQAGAVTTNILAAGSVTTDKVEAGAITAGKLAASNVITLTAQIGDALISTAKIIDGAITTAKIGDAQITSAKIGNAAITNAKIGNLEVDSAKIANLTVGTQKLENNAATSTWSGRSDTLVTFAAATYYNVLQVTINKTTSGDLVVWGALPLIGPDATDCYIHCYIYPAGGGSLLASDSDTMKLDADGTTSLPKAFFFLFSGIGAGSYEVRLGVTRYNSNALSTGGTGIFRKMVVVEFRA